MCIETGMKTDLLPSPADLTIVTVPQPAARQTAAFLQAIVTTGKAPILCDVATSGLPEITATTVYLRPEVIDVLDLAIMADRTGTEGIRDACCRLAKLDDQWGHLPRLSLEDVIARPYEAARFLSHRLETPLGDGAAVIESRIDALRQYVAGYDHPLAFLASVEPCVGSAEWEDHGLHDDIGEFIFLDTPRRILVLTDGERPNTPVPLRDVTNWTVAEIPFGDGCAARLRDIAVPQGVIHLNHAEDAAIDDLLDPIMTHLSTRGILSGEERAETAAESVIARLTKGGDDHDLVFLLSGHRWLATPRSWRR